MSKFNVLCRGFHPWKLGTNLDFLKEMGEEIPVLDEVVVDGVKYTGEWIKGYALNDTIIVRETSSFEMSGIPDHYDETLVSSGLIENLYADRIIPQTRAVSTGMNDKNGKEIFEDMIVRTKRGLGYIVFCDGCFCVQIFNEKSKPAIDIVFNEGDVEIVGDIYSNHDTVKTEVIVE